MASPSTSATAVPIGTKMTGGDGGTWQVVLASNGTPRWQKAAGGAVAKAAAKPMKAVGQSKSVAIGKSRPSPSVSATAVPVGTKRTGGDGGKWQVVMKSNGVPGWKKL